VIWWREPTAGAPARVEASREDECHLGRTIVLPYDAEWFSVPPAAPHGQKPMLGTLYPSLMRAVEAAYRAARD
jgi:hypothetical protein